MALTLPVAHGQLEAILQAPPEGKAPRFAAVVCHPHPLYGGTMHNKVVYHTAKALVGQGGAVVRFNFRGVGASTGRYDEGQGEREDARAALDWLEGQFPSLPLWMAGFSFGAYVGVPVGCGDARVRAVLALGFPVRLMKVGPPPACQKPFAVIQGGRDEFGPLDELEATLAGWPSPVVLRVVDGADHFFTGRIDELRATVAEVVAPWLPE
jgi:hypothetical protein